MPPGRKLRQKISKKLAKMETLRRRPGGDKCHLCGSPLDFSIRRTKHPLYVTVDHLIPKSLGGGDHINNLKLAHRSCNMRRGNSMEFGE
jgi:5-methylcytosine-specific restriction endonuclease McrA